MNWAALISGIVQIVLLILQNKFEKDADEKKRKEALHEGWKEVVASGDTKRISDFLERVRT